MAGGGSAAGPVQTIRHQAPGAQTRRFTVTIYIFMDSFIAFNLAFRYEPHNERVDSANSMQKIVGSRHVFTFFEPVWNGLYTYILIYMLNCRIIVKYIVAHTSMYQYILVYTSMYQYILVYSLVCHYVHTSTYH